MEAFFESWFTRLDELRSHLLSALSYRPDSLPQAVDALLDHYREYRDANAQLADADVLRALAHPWLTPFEHTFLWVAGWKPSVAFHLLPCPVSPDQRAAVEELRREVVARSQEAMAGQAVLEDIRGGTRNGNLRTAEDAVARALHSVVGAADELRDSTLRQAVDILTPAQTAEFLAAAAELRLRVRRWGLQRNGHTA